MLISLLAVHIVCRLTTTDQASIAFLPVSLDSSAILSQFCSYTTELYNLPNSSFLPPTGPVKAPCL